MSGGGGSSGGTTTTTQELPDWAQPYAQQLLQRGADLSNQPVPQYGGQTVAGLSGTQNQGITNTNQAATNAGNLANQASQYANQVTGSSGPQVNNPYTGNVTASTAADSYADPSNNPYLQNVINSSNNAITTAYNNTTAPQTLAQFRNAGAFGGSAQQQATANNEYQLGQALAANTANISNNAYNTGAQVASQNAAQQNNVNLANQSVGTAAGQATNALNSNNYFANINAGNQALQTASGINQGYGASAGQQLGAGAVQQQNSQDQLNALYQQWFNSVNAPYSQLSTLSQALSGALGSGTGITTSQQQPGSGSTLGSLLGLGSLGLGAYGLLGG